MFKYFLHQEKEHFNANALCNRIPNNCSNSHVKKVTELKKKKQKKLQIEPSKTSCFNTGSIAAKNEITFALSMQHVSRVSGSVSQTNVIVDNWQKRRLVTQWSKEKWHAKTILPTTSSKSAPNITMTQNIQNGIPYVLLVVLETLLRRECGRSGGGPFAEMLSWTITKRHTSPKSGNKLSPDAKLTSSKCSWI